MTYQQPNAAPPGRQLGLLAELLRNLRLAWRLMRDPRVARFSKFLVPALAVLYVASPVDLLPDFIPALGQLDDLAIVALAVRLFIQMAPPAIVAEHEAELDRAGRPAGDGETVDAQYRVVK